MAQPARLPDWTRLLDEQSRVIARGQGLRSGLSEEAWQWRLSREIWQSPLPGIAVAHRGELTFEEKVWSAVLYGVDGAAASGDALLRLLSPRWPEPDRIDVAVRGGSEQKRKGFFRPHPCAALPELLHPLRRPLQVRAAPAVLQAAAWAPSDRAGEWRVAAAVQQRLVKVGALREALLLLPRLNRRQAIERVLDDVELGAHARTELDFLAFLRRNTLPLPSRLQFLVRANGKRYLDAWWELQRVAAEVDGAHHQEVGTWDDDTLRSNAVLVASRDDRVLLLRVTAGNLRHSEPELAAQFRAVLLG